MKLTQKQQQIIGDELITGGIIYQDLYDELFDHYVTALEERLQKGQTFGEAFGEIHGDFVAYKRPARVWDHYGIWQGTEVYGLVKLQEEYRQNLNQEFQKRHWQIVKSYFRWPMVVAMLLVAVLSYKTAYLMPPLWFVRAIYLVMLMPILVVLPHAFQQIWRYIRKKNRLRSSLKGTAISSRAGILSILTNAFNGFLTFDYSFLKQTHVAILAAVMFAFVVYSISFWQLYREKFKIKWA